MPVNYDMLGKRIRSFRTQREVSQEYLAETTILSREYIARIETGKKKPSLDVIVDIANALGVSADDLLSDSLEHSVSTANTELHQLLLDCTKTEVEIITRMAKELKAILYSQGI